MKNSQSPSFEEMLLSMSSGNNELQSVVNDYKEIVPRLIRSHNICCHYANIEELDGDDQTAIQELWFVAMAILSAGIKQTQS